MMISPNEKTIVEVKTPDYRESLNGASLFFNLSTVILDQFEEVFVSSCEEKRQMTNISSLIHLSGAVSYSISK